MTRKKTPDFEQSLEELEQLVERMEQGGTNLDQSLTDFERGIELTRICQKALDDAEQKVQVLVRENGQDQLIPFDNNED